MHARQNLGERPRSYSDFEAIHRIDATTEVFNFFAVATSIAKEILTGNHNPNTDVNSEDIDLGPQIEIEGVAPPVVIEQEKKEKDISWYHQDDYYRIYGHDDVWVGVLGASASRRNAQAARKILQANDIGIIKQEASDAIARLPNKFPMHLMFDSVMLIGRKQTNGNASGMQSRLALVPVPGENPETIQRLFEEYRVVTRFLQRRHSQAFISDTYTPLAEFMTFRHESTHNDISDIIAGINKNLAKQPLKVSLKELEFPDPRVRIKHKR